MRVVKYPHPILSYESKPLRKIDAQIRDVAAEMFKLMYENAGVGLAANQVDLPYQMVVVNQTGDPEHKEEEFVLINPVILKLKGANEDGEEGCLSFPGLRMIVPRAKEVKLQAIDLEGKVQTYFWKGFQARIAQHEIDHLHGTCFFQRACATITPNYEVYLQKMREQFKKDVEAGTEPTPEQFKEEVAKWEAERT